MQNQNLVEKSQEKRSPKRSPERPSTQYSKSRTKGKLECKESEVAMAEEPLAPPRVLKVNNLPKCNIELDVKFQLQHPNKNCYNNVDLPILKSLQKQVKEYMDSRQRGRFRNTVHLGLRGEVLVVLWI